MEQRQRQRRKQPNSNPGDTSAEATPKEASNFDQFQDKIKKDDNGGSKTNSQFKRGRRNPVWWIGFGVLVLVVLVAVRTIWESIGTPKQRVYYGVLGASLFPVALVLYAAVRPGKEIHQRITPIVVVACILCGRFPKWCTLYLNAALAGAAVFLFGWITRPLQQGKDSGMSKQMQYNFAKTTLCAVLLTVVLVSENFWIWVVSATFEPGWSSSTAPEPLQDNGRRVMQSFFDSLELTKRDVVSMRRVWNVQWALVAALGAALCTVDFHPTRQLWSMGCRALLTLASARFLRTISFLLTVLPSQNKYCYQQHFPYPPPADWETWLLEGLQPNSSGGCNDLIVSGHATVITTAACVATGMAEDPLFSVAVSMLLALDFGVEIYEGFHYSVDMWMGAVLVGLLWRVWKPFEDNNTDRNDTTLHDMTQRFWNDKLTLRDAAYYGGPVLVAFLQVTVFPAFWGIPIMVSMVAAIVSQLVAHGFQQYHKHVFYCILCMLLGIFL